VLGFAVAKQKKSKNKNEDNDSLPSFSSKLTPTPSLSDEEYIMDEPDIIQYRLSPMV